MFANNLKRFEALYQRLLTQHYRDQVRAQAISKEDLKIKGEALRMAESSEVTWENKVQIIAGLAKTDILSILKDEKHAEIKNVEEETKIKVEMDEMIKNLIERLNRKENEDKEEKILEGRDVYLCCSFIIFLKFKKHLNDVSMNNLYLLLRTIIFSLKPAEESYSDETEEGDFYRNESMIKDDKQVQQRLALTGFLIKQLSKMGGHKIVYMLLEDIQQEIAKFQITDPNSILHDSKLKAVSIIISFSISFFKNKAFSVAISNKEIQTGLSNILDQILKISDSLKERSKYYMLNFAAGASWKRQGAGNKEIKRSEGNFSELWNLIIQYCTVYANGMGQIVEESVIRNQTIHIFQTFLLDSQCNSPESGDTAQLFILSERLTITSNLNSLFHSVQAILQHPQYWQNIIQGLYHIDPVCRKLSIEILQFNLGKFESQTELQSEQQRILQDFSISKKQFDLMWQTFFDLYDTLDQYSSHLTKSMWERCELLHSFLRSNSIQWQKPQFTYYKLADFKVWLEALIKRSQTHQNLNIRKYVQKEILGRSYMGSPMAEFLFKDFMLYLNEGHILKDSNSYTQFSKNNKLIHTFYSNFLKNESIDKVRDLQQLLKTVSMSINHPQIILGALKILQIEDCEQVQFVGGQQLQELKGLILNLKSEYGFSNKYISFKTILKILGHNLDIKRINQGDQQQVNNNFSNFLQIIGQMPFELFSASQNINYTDREGLTYAQNLVDHFGQDSLRQFIKIYLDDIFQVKANLNSMPRFQGTRENQKNQLNGLIRLFLILDTCYEDENTKWVESVMLPNLNVFLDQIMASSYLSSEVIDQKISFFAILCDDLVKYSATQSHRDFLMMVVRQSAPQILDRLENSLLIPLMLYTDAGETGEISINQRLQDRQKKESVFQKLKSFSIFVNLAVRCFHVYVPQSYFQYDRNGSVVERFMKLILGQALKLTQLTTNPITQLSDSIFNHASISHKSTQFSNNLPAFLAQYSVLELVVSALSAYSSGINENIQKQIDNILIPNDVFSVGKSLLFNLAHLKPINFDQNSICSKSGRPFMADLFEDIQKLMIESNLEVKNVTKSIKLNMWTTISELIKLFQFDPQLLQQIRISVFPLLKDNALEHLKEEQSYTDADAKGARRAQGANWCKEDGLFNKVIFRILNLVYIPLSIQEILDGREKKDEIRQSVEHYLKTVNECWRVIASLKGVFELQALIECLEFAFSEKMLEVLQEISMIDKEILIQVQNFYEQLCQDVMETGNKVWLVMRSTLNHILPIISLRPYILHLGFSSYISNFLIAREIKSLDSDIHLHKLETMLPSIIPQKFERFSLDEISYQGAYVRCITLIAFEGIVFNLTNQILSIGNLESLKIKKLMDSLEGLEQIVIDLLKMNEKLCKNPQSEMPLSQQFRDKVRIWQALLILLPLVNPDIYTSEYRMRRREQCGFDVVEEITRYLWKSIKANQLATVRQYIEIFTVKFCLAFPIDTIGTAEFNSSLLNPNVKPQVSSSYLVIAGYCMQFLKTGNDGLDTQFKKKIFDSIFGFCCSNSANTRVTAQYFCVEMLKDPLFKPFIPQSLDIVYSFLLNEQTGSTFNQKHKAEMDKFIKFVQSDSLEYILSRPIDEYGEFMHEPFIIGLKQIISNVMTELRKSDLKMPEREQLWLKEFQMRNQENFDLHYSLVAKGAGDILDSMGTAENTSLDNFQRKVMPWEDMEMERDKIRNLVEKRRRNQIIVCASLIDKVPNLAGLTRTCEIMNAQALVIGNKDLVKMDEFKNISVTAEKWLPIYEVIEENVLKYLQFQKQNGYTILGLEQTANSQMLNKFQFPSKCILLVGKEKEGIPQEYFQVIDQCIEIPQFGVIRSLNVHVSGALCLWEFTKQMQGLKESKI